VVLLAGGGVARITEPDHPTLSRPGAEALGAPHHEGDGFGPSTSSRMPLGGKETTRFCPGSSW